MSSMGVGRGDDKTREVSSAELGRGREKPQPRVLVESFSPMIPRSLRRSPQSSCNHAASSYRSCRGCEPESILPLCCLSSSEIQRGWYPPFQGACRGGGDPRSDAATARIAGSGRMAPSLGWVDGAAGCCHRDSLLLPWRKPECGQTVTQSPK